MVSIPGIGGQKWQKGRKTLAGDAVALDSLADEILHLRVTFFMGRPRRNGSTPRSLWKQRTLHDLGVATQEVFPDDLPIHDGSGCHGCKQGYNNRCVVQGEYMMESSGGPVGASSVYFIFVQNMPDPSLFEPALRSFTDAVAMSGLAVRECLVATDCEMGAKPPVTERPDLMEWAYAPGRDLVPMRPEAKNEF